MLCDRKIYMKWFFFYLYAKYFSKIHHVLPNDALNFCVYMTYFLFFFQHNKRQNETCVLGLLHFYKDLMSAAPVGSHHGGLSASVSPYPGFSWLGLLSFCQCHCLQTIYHKKSHYHLDLPFHTCSSCYKSPLILG